MNNDERRTLIQDQTVAMWRIYNRRLRPEESGTDLLVIQDYVTALERVPNKRIIEVFNRAKRLDRLPRPDQLAELWRPAQKSSLSGEKPEPFRPDFRRYLCDTAAFADKMYAQTGIRDYRVVADICDQADMQCHGAIQQLTQMQTTSECIGLMRDWAMRVSIPQTIIQEVMTQEKPQ